MPKKIEERIHILCQSRAYLAPAKVMGPIVHPLSVSKSVAVQLLMSGAELYEYIPKTKKTIKLTLGNINDTNRYFDTGISDNNEIKSIPVTPVIKTGVPNINDKHEEISVDTNVEIPNETPEDSDNKILEFTYNEDGTVDESKINWSEYTKNQRKEIRVRINEHNSTIATK